jgi:hypothetical protein
MRGIYLLAEKLLASQEGLCSMQLVSESVSYLVHLTQSSTVHNQPKVLLVGLYILPRFFQTAATVNLLQYPRAFQHFLPSTHSTNSMTSTKSKVLKCLINILTGPTKWYEKVECSAFIIQQYLFTTTENTNQSFGLCLNEMLLVPTSGPTVYLRSMFNWREWAWSIVTFSKYLNCFARMSDPAPLWVTSSLFNSAV